MPAFLFTAKDVPNSAELRTKYLIEHLTFAESMYANILVGGPCFQTATPNVMDRSLVLLEAPDADAARSMFESDPYFKNKIWASYEMMAFTPVIGTYLGGKSWDLVNGKVVRKELPPK
ncbi:MAG: hypothetical protein JNM81_16650 [Rhodospirillaceae bacterium]|nr:hypothetical protein [Rhodospirillaceae bacterium]